MDFKTVEKFIFNLLNVSKAFPFDKNVAVYYIGGKKQFDQENMFALIEIDSEPLRISLKSDPNLATILRQRYETVLPAANLSHKKWNTIILTGQLPWSDIQDLIRHSYNITINSD
jgi:predicted DNA-binding protein (MmcQ/YjbR family)